MTLIGWSADLNSEKEMDMLHIRTRKLLGGVLALAIIAVSSVAQAEEISVSIKNLSKRDGLYLTPVWVAFHDGTFDPFDVGSPVMPGGGVERIAEDGDASAVMAGFAASPAGMAGGMDDLILAPNGFPDAPVFDPREGATVAYTVSPDQHRYFSFLSMVIPSNDAFIGNDDPMHLELFDAEGTFQGPIDIMVYGDMVHDAGTEANTEMDAAFFDQTAPDTGMTTADSVQQHEGFAGSFANHTGPRTILGGTSVAPPGIFFHRKRADFTRPGYRIARIRIRLIPNAADNDQGQE